MTEGFLTNILQFWIFICVCAICTEYRTPCLLPARSVVLANKPDTDFVCFHLRWGFH